MGNGTGNPLEAACRPIPSFMADGAVKPKGERRGMQYWAG